MSASLSSRISRLEETVEELVKFMRKETNYKTHSMRDEDYVCQECGKTAMWIRHPLINVRNPDYDHHPGIGYSCVQGPVSGAWCEECHAKLEEKE
jgi:hypothetical protein